MRRRVEYHRDGTVRMDYYTFCDLKVDKVWAALTQRRLSATYSAVSKVREFK